MKSGFVSVVGSPNVGKSTLINEVIGKKVSIVTDTAHTTRDMIKGIYNEKDLQIVFLDTPGFHDSRNKLNVYMNHQIDHSLYGTDLIIYMLDAEFLIGKKEKKNIDRLAQIKNIDIVVFINKIDLVSQEKVNKLVESLAEYKFIKQVYSFSVKEFFDKNSVIEIIKPYLTSDVKFYDGPEFYDYSDEFFISGLFVKKCLN